MAYVFLLAVQQPATSPAPAAAQTTGESTEAIPLNIDNLPVSLGRIQRALAAPPPIQLKEAHPVFRLEIFGRQQTIEDILGEKFWLGPAPYGGMTHRDFLDMVTPQMAQSYAGFTGKYLVAETALTLFEMWALKSAIKKFHGAKDEHEREVARKEVLDALADLERAKKKAAAQGDR